MPQSLFETCLTELDPTEDRRRWAARIRNQFTFLPVDFSVVSFIASIRWESVHVPPCRLPRGTQFASGKALQGGRPAKKA